MSVQRVETISLEVKVEVGSIDDIRPITLDDLRQLIAEAELNNLPGKSKFTFGCHAIHLTHREVRR